MGKTLRVEPAQVSAASKTLSSLSSKYSSIASQMMQKADNMGSAWDSEDNKAFVTQIDGFCEDLKQMAQKLESASEMLNLQYQNYENRKNDNIAQVKKLAN